MKGTFESEAIWCSKLLLTHPSPEGKQSCCDTERFLCACMGCASDSRVRDISTLLQHRSYEHPLAWCTFQLGDPHHHCNYIQTQVDCWQLLECCTDSTHIPYFNTNAVTMHLSRASVQEMYVLTSHGFAKSYIFFLEHFFLIQKFVKTFNKPGWHKDCHVIRKVWHFALLCSCAHLEHFCVLVLSSVQHCWRKLQLE